MIIREIKITRDFRDAYKAKDSPHIVLPIVLAN